MKNNIYKKLEKLTKSKKKRRLIKNSLLAIASLMVFVTVYVLILPAITAEKDNLGVPEQAYEAEVASETTEAVEVASETEVFSDEETSETEVGEQSEEAEDISSDKESADDTDTEDDVSDQTDDSKEQQADDQDTKDEDSNEDAEDENSEVDAEQDTEDSETELEDVDDKDSDNQADEDSDANLDFDSDSNTEENIDSDNETEEKENSTELVEEDAESYTAVIQAYKLPSETPEEKEIKRAIVDKSLKKATEVPFEVLEISKKSLKLARELEGKSNPNVASDIAVAAMNFVDSAKSAWLNVKINLPSIDKCELKAKIDERGDKNVNEIEKEANLLYLDILNKF